MKVDVSTVNSYQKKLAFTIPAEDVRQSVEAAYRTLASRARVHGFRPGKVPRKVLEARFGQQVHADVAETLIQRSWGKAIEEHRLEPVGRPNLDDVHPLKPADPFHFTILVDVKPAVTVTEYQGVEVTWPKVEVKDEAIEHAVRHRLEGNARMVEVEDRAVALHDFVLAELEIKDGDTVVVHEPGTMIRTEADPYYPGVEAHLVGMARNEVKSVRVAFPDDARAEAVAGRELDVTVKVLGIQANLVPDLTDDLAKELGFEGGADGMRAALRADIESKQNEMARNQARANLLQVLIEKHPFEVPDSMVEKNLELLMNELKLQQMLRGADPKKVRFSDAQVADLRQRAAFATKAGLILEAVTATEKIAVTDEDIERKMRELADQRGQTIEAVKGFFQKEGAVDELKERLLEEKTLDWLLERAKLKT